MFSMTVPTGQTSTIVRVESVPSGLLWIVDQIGISTNPFRVGASCTIKRGLEFIANSAIASADTAGGQPAILLTSSDVLTAEFIGMTAGDQVALTLFVEEIVWTNNPVPKWVV